MDELKGFIEKHEYDKKNISEKDQYFMVMQLLQCAYEAEIKKIEGDPEENRELTEYRWKLIRKHIKDLWDITLCNKYQVVMTRITALNIWGATKSIQRENSSHLQDSEFSDEYECPTA